MNGPAIDAAAWSGRWRGRSPGDKALLGLGLTGTALLLPAWPGSLLVTVTAVALVLGPAGVDRRVLVAAARGPLAFIVLGAAGIAVTWRTGDDPGWGVGRPGPAVTPAGLAQAARTTAHAIAGACGVLLLAATTPVTDLLGPPGSATPPAEPPCDRRACSPQRS